jgi:hypothetical protein
VTLRHATRGREGGGEVPQRFVRDRVEYELIITAGGKREGS